jgi:ribonuclease BN (tRNA processing enzyme)
LKLTFLGTCSGTEPMPDRFHTAYVIEHNGGVYWFDAGEGCSYNAHLLGIDILAIQSLCFSHCHLDHVGGLVNLLGTIRKLEGRNEDPTRSIAGRTIPVRIPNLNVWQGALNVLQGPSDSCHLPFESDVQTYADGVILDQDGLKVTALHNRHLGEPSPGTPWQSFSFRIETATQSIVSSGDIKHVSEVVPLIGQGCDLFLMETGHHQVDEVCTYLMENDVPFGRLGFFHHGRAILADPKGECVKAQNIVGDRVFVADDGMVIDFN